MIVCFFSIFPGRHFLNRYTAKLGVEVYRRLSMTEHIVVTPLPCIFYTDCNKECIDRTIRTTVIIANEISFADKLILDFPMSDIREPCERLKKVLGFKMFDPFDQLSIRREDHEDLFKYKCHSCGTVEDWNARERPAVEFIKNQEFKCFKCDIEQTKDLTKATNHKYGVNEWSRRGKTEIR